MRRGGEKRRGEEGSGMDKRTGEERQEEKRRGKWGEEEERWEERKMKES